MPTVVPNTTTRSIVYIKPLMIYFSYTKTMDNSLTWLDSARELVSWIRPEHWTGVNKMVVWNI